MNFYPFHIGDYAGATRHLSWDEDMAYRRMLDAYYSREQLLPVDRRQLYRLVGATEKRQREAVDAVLVEFFEETSDGWRNARADEELGKALVKKERARQSAAMRWGGAQHSEGNANTSPDAMRTHSEGNATRPNPNPNMSSRVVQRPRDPDAELERKLREAAGWQNEPAPKLAITGEIQALIDSGADVDLDVLPIVKAIAPKVNPTNWSYFVKPIAEQRDRRIAAATVISLPNSTARTASHGTRQQKPSRAETFDAIRSRIDQLEAAEAQSGAAAAGDTGPRDPAEGAS